MTRHPRWVHRILSRDDLAAIVDAITRAESLTSAEVRVHLERRVKRAHAGGDPTLARARDIFARLGMHDTAHRASVLTYLPVADRNLPNIGRDAPQAPHRASRHGSGHGRARRRRGHEGRVAAHAE